MRPRRVWRFTALEFRTLWEVAGRDVLPYPLRHQFTTEYRSDSRRLMREAATGLRSRLDEELDLAVGILLAPQSRIEIAGYGRGVPTVRAYGGMFDGHAALAVQEVTAGEDGQAGDVVVSLLDADTLAPACLAAIPSCAPARGQELRVSAGELRGPRPHVSDPWNPPPRQRFEKFLAQPVDAVTHVGVYANGSVDNRHTDGRSVFELRDLTGDGRYVVHGTATVIAKPAVADRVVTTLRSILTRVATQAREGVYPAR